MKSKSECLQKFKVLCAQVGTPKLLHTDNGTEYSGKTFADFCIQKGIKKEFTAPYSPHQSDVCELRWRTTVAPMSNAYNIFDPKTDKSLASRNVSFNEHSFQQNPLHEESSSSKSFPIESCCES